MVNILICGLTLENVKTSVGFTKINISVFINYNDYSKGQSTAQKCLSVCLPILKLFKYSF